MVGRRDHDVADGSHRQVAGRVDPVGGAEAVEGIAGIPVRDPGAARRTQVLTWAIASVVPFTLGFTDTFTATTAPAGDLRGPWVAERE